MFICCVKFGNKDCAGWQELVSTLKEFLYSHINVDTGGWLALANAFFNEIP